MYSQGVVPNGGNGFLGTFVQADPVAMPRDLHIIASAHSHMEREVGGLYYGPTGSTRSRSRASAFLLVLLLDHSAMPEVARQLFCSAVEASGTCSLGRESSAHQDVMLPRLLLCRSAG